MNLQMPEIEIDMDPPNSLYSDSEFEDDSSDYEELEHLLELEYESDDEEEESDDDTFEDGSDDEGEEEEFYSVLNTVKPWVDLKLLLEKEL